MKNEVKVNVLNRPYGGFPWLDMPQVANENWFNAHNFYGDLKDLDAATLKDAEAFFKSFYSPGNAALVVTGDFEPEAAFKWIQEYFGPIPSAPHQELARHLRAAPGEGEADAPSRTVAGAAPRARGRVPRAEAQHARVLRPRPHRADPRGRQRQPAP